MNTLDIIIPQYKENDKIVNRLLLSINKQKNIDFKTLGIIIVNDASNVKLSKKLFKEFPRLNITYLRNEINSGPGITRQNGIDASKARYVTFMDADDMYYTNNALELVYKAINESNPDLILTKWLEEDKEFNQIKLIPHDSDVIWVHGKFIKRQYLIDNNIRFSNNLRMHEDSYFSTLLLMSVDNPYYINEYTYLWKHDANSIVRAKRKYPYLVETYNDSLKSIIELSNVLSERKINRYDEYIIKSIYYFAYSLQSHIFNIDDYTKSLREKYEYEVLLYYKEYKNLFKNFNSNEINEFSQRQYESLKNMLGNLNISLNINQYYLSLGMKYKVNLWEELMNIMKIL